MVFRLECSPISTEELWSSVTVTIGFLVTSLTKDLLPRLLSLAGWPALGRGLVVKNVFNLRTMEATMLLGTLNAAELFWILSQSCRDNILDLMSWLLLWHVLSTVQLHIDRCVLFQIISNQFHLPQMDSNRVVETSQAWAMETGSTWAQFWDS
jgi:hypothetical protein